MQRERGRVAAGEVDERQPALRRRPVGLAGQAHPAGEPLHHVVVAALGRPRPGHAEARQRAADDPRVDVAQVARRCRRSFARLVAAQVRVDGVDDAHEVLEDAAAVRVRAGRARRSSCSRLNVSKKSESSPSWNGGT